ncbi:hypothetical protein Afil01_46200 [Actinorhabdospora filicis]|uniref:Uncharacterized protein n=1 Tax=Actinorhabdospora filicis TaxID=1785913 RepID=A0A9W6SPM3_9ACTN|nr:hypothetical protein [Actinorhabdospora filicis]GLZ79813.1 hypothetical protein Afil01_46200 [Actinorhabdospora filicis]
MAGNREAGDMNGPAPLTKTIRFQTWTLGAAALLSAAAAILHTFVQATPTLDALMASTAAPETRQSLRMMWHGMSAIAWTHPVLLALLWRRPAGVARPALAFLAVLNGTQALFLVAAGLWAEGAAGLLSLPQWAPHAAVAALAWAARPSAPTEPGRPGHRGRARLVLLWATTIVTGCAAVYHLIVGTFHSWPADLLDGDTASPAKPALYAMWLFSCVVFASVPAVLVWSTRAPAAAGRFLVRYTAVLVACLMASWTLTLILGYGPDMLPAGPVTLGLMAALTAMSVPERA